MVVLACPGVRAVPVAPLIIVKRHRVKKVVILRSEGRGVKMTEKIGDIINGWPPRNILVIEPGVFFL